MRHGGLRARRGGNALFMAHVAKSVAPKARVYACDTYAGMPVTDAARDLHGAGDFSEASFEALSKRRDKLKL